MDWGLIVIHKVENFFSLYDFGIAIFLPTEDTHCLTYISSGSRS